MFLMHNKNSELMDVRRSSFFQPFMVECYTRVTRSENSCNSINLCLKSLEFFLEIKDSPFVKAEPLNKFFFSKKFSEYLNMFHRKKNF